jgi:hypothetical protein
LLLQFLLSRFPLFLCLFVQIAVAGLAIWTNPTRQLHLD